MRKIFITVVILIIALCHNSKAEQEWQSGLLFGINSSAMYGDKIKDFSATKLAIPVIGFDGGCYLSREISRNFYFQPEIRLVLKGYATDDNYYSGSGSTSYSSQVWSTGTYRLLYFEIPLLFKARFNTVSKGTPEIMIGPSCSIFATGLNEPAGRFNQNFDNYNINRFDYGVIFGAGMDYDWMMFNLRFYYGMNQYVREQDAYSRSLIFTLGFNSQNTKRSGR
ncbi:MAG: PorT family protein [FCB group bacterium]|nr:PorT family protein [FCB group bacterium]